MIFSKIAENAKIRTAHLCDEHERQILMTAFFDLPGTVNTTAISINQNRYNPFGVIRMLTFGTVVAFYGMGIELLKKIGIEITFMIFR